MCMVSLLIDGRPPAFRIPYSIPQAEAVGKMENGWSTEIRFQRSPLQDPPAGAGELLQGTARGHLAEHGHGLDAADVGPLPLGDGVEPKDLARLPAGLQQGPCGPGHVDGLGVEESANNLHKLLM